MICKQLFDNLKNNNEILIDLNIVLKSLIDYFKITPSSPINKNLATALETVFAKLIRVSTGIICKCYKIHESAWIMRMPIRDVQIQRIGISNVSFESSEQRLLYKQINTRMNRFCLTKEYNKKYENKWLLLKVCIFSFMVNFRMANNYLKFFAIIRIWVASSSRHNLNSYSNGNKQILLENFFRLYSEFFKLEICLK